VQKLCKSCTRNINCAKREKKKKKKKGQMRGTKKEDLWGTLIMKFIFILGMANLLAKAMREV
jgi:hypothetical protein